MLVSKFINKLLETKEKKQTQSEKIKQGFIEKVTFDIGLCVEKNKVEIIDSMGLESQPTE